MMHWTSLYRPPLTPDMGPTPLLMSGGDHCRPVQTCSLEDLSPHSTDIKWLPQKDVWLASRRYVSHWNAFLLIMDLRSLTGEERIFVKGMLKN